jgi:aminomethyltransferase
VSHLGKIAVTGRGAADLVNRCLTNDIGRVRPGQAQYTLLCRDDGGVVDDMIAYLRSDEDVLLVPNAANCATVTEFLADAAPGGVTVTDLHEELAVLAVQGPRSDEVLVGAGLPVGHPYMSFAAARHAGVEVVVCRTGYTGERGYELVVPSIAATSLWDAVVGAGEPAGLRPAGLGARDTLRTEMGYPLHGQDMSTSVTAVQAGLSWAVGWDKPSFPGAEALRSERRTGASRRLRGLLAEGRGIPRPGMAVLDPSGRRVGSVTSGTFSPTLRKGVALALLDVGHAEGDPVGVDIRGRQESFRITRPPFVASHVRDD